MPIQFHCSNIVAYDSATEKYVRCDQLLTAPDDQIAKFIACPKCNARALVPPGSETTPSELPLERAVTPRSTESPDRSHPEAASTVASTLKFSAFDAKSRCTRCGGGLDANFRCVVCGHQSVLPAGQINLETIEIQPAGCQLWLSKKLAHGIGPSNLLIAAHGFITILLIILATTAISLGGGASTVVLAVILLIAASYTIVVYESRRIARKAPANLNWWQKSGWNLVLHLIRAAGWPSGNSNARWQILDLKNKPFSDADIFALPDITKYQVLDLEGTMLTDSGLLKLQGLVGLQRLVVRRTKVTQPAVFTLQQRLPQVWIWN